jgi:hypothetical protein
MGCSAHQPVGVGGGGLWKIETFALRAQDSGTARELRPEAS